MLRALQAQVAPFNAVPKAAFWITWSLQESLVWAGLIVLWVSWQGRLPGWLERTMAHGGKVSFSFYLLHMGVVQLAVRTVGLPAWSGLPWFDALLSAVLVYGAVWAVATLSFQAIEEPFLRLRGACVARRDERERDDALVHVTPYRMERRYQMLRR